MSTNSNDQGRAYEYAWMETLYEALYHHRKTTIISNSSLVANKRAWSIMSDDMQHLFNISANAAIETILELEPRMVENDDDELTLEFQKDEAGTEGDVRDIVIKRNDIAWEIGLSIKHNHEAVKHSRLSHRLDIGKEWFGVNCSKEYWAEVKPIFDRLKSEKAKRTKWSEIIDKEESVYTPLLKAFIDEVKRAYAVDSSITRKMIEYLIGTEDYYKIVSMDNKRLTMIHTFNIHDTLNKPSKIKVSAITVPVIDLPTELVAIKFKSGSNNTVEMYLNNGWQLSFRIHNASSKVEPSLKFDIQFIGMPVSILNLECKWNESLMNDAVYKFKRYEDSSLSYTGINRHAGEKVGLFSTVVDFDEMFADQQSSMEAPPADDGDMPENPFAFVTEEEEDGEEPPVPEKPAKKRGGRNGEVVVIRPAAAANRAPKAAAAVSSAAAKPAPAPAVPAAPPKPSFDVSSLSVGTAVLHKAFGVGTITAIDPDDIKFRYITVAFPDTEKRFQIPNVFLQGFLKLQ